MDQGFPGQHTTTTTVTTDSATYQQNIRFDPAYIRTLPGILKCVQMVANVLGFIFITLSHYSNHGRGGYFNTVAMGGFWITGLLLVFYIFHVVEKFFRIPWLRIEFFYCAIWTLLYLIAAGLAVDYARYSESYAIAAVFGFIAMAAYGYDGWLKFTAFKRGDAPQGHRETSKQVTTVSSPAY